MILPDKCGNSSVIVIVQLLVDMGFTMSTHSRATLGSYFRKKSSSSMLFREMARSWHEVVGNTDLQLLAIYLYWSVQDRGSYIDNQGLRPRLLIWTNPLRRWGK